MRYHLAWFDPESAPGGPDEALLRDWAVRGRPAIVRRRQACDAVNTVPLAVTLPNALGRRRLAFEVAAGQVHRTAPPPPLPDALRSAPVDWRANWPEALTANARVHGGLMWQHLTGEPYLRPGSDLDLLLWIETRGELDEIVAALEPMTGRCEPRIDGELIFPDGSAVPWREWLSGAPALLAKQAGRACFIERGALLDMVSTAERRDALPAA